MSSWRKRAFVPVCLAGVFRNDSFDAHSTSYSLTYSLQHLVIFLVIYDPRHICNEKMSICYCQIVRRTDIIQSCFTINLVPTVIILVLLPPSSWHTSWTSPVIMMSMMNHSYSISKIRFFHAWKCQMLLVSIISDDNKNKRVLKVLSSLGQCFTFSIPFTLLNSGRRNLVIKTGKIFFFYHIFVEILTLYFTNYHYYYYCYCNYNCYYSTICMYSFCHGRDLNKNLPLISLSTSMLHINIENSNNKSISKH